MLIKEGKIPFKQDYYNRHIREVCRGIKDRDNEAIKEAAGFFINLDLIKKHDILILSPQHEGIAVYTLSIGKIVSDETGAEIYNILTSHPRDSLYTMKASHQKIVPPDFICTPYNIPLDTGNIWFLDNVYDTGATFKAAERAVRINLSPLIYAYVKR